MIAGYVGGSDKLDRALCRFARAYADQTEADHRALSQAVARGVLPVEVEQRSPNQESFVVLGRPPILHSSTSSNSA